MDPITQGAVGAVVAQIRCPRPHFFHAAIIGAAGGMAPDLDVLIRSNTDPLLVLEYHRQITHSLVFIPVLGALCGILMHALFGDRWRVRRGEAILWATLGCATHGLLDSCTSYGTQLLWPFSDYRVAWDIVSIVDPLFTLPLLTAIWLATKFHSSRWAIVGMLWMSCYLGLGYIQNQRALAMGHDLAAQRGHTPLRLQAKPSFANLLVWKVVYETEQRFYVDAVRPGGDQVTIWQGDSLPKFAVDEAFPWLPDDARQRRDIARFRHFSSGFIAIDPQNPMRVIDIRYSMLPQEIKPLWGIELSAGKNSAEHAAFYTQRDSSAEKLQQLIAMLTSSPTGVGPPPKPPESLPRTAP